MKRFSFISLLLLLPAFPAPATTPPGRPAAHLGLQAILQAPPGTKADWPGLEGKAVVLEFWASWCAPCVMAMSHLNNLAAAVKGEPIRFLAITDESRASVEHFLQKHELKAWIGLDADRSAFDDYGITSIPQTVLVDAHGRIRAVTSPFFVTETALRELAAGKTPSLDWTSEASPEGPEPHGAAQP